MSPCGQDLPEPGQFGLLQGTGDPVIRPSPGQTEEERKT